MKNILIIEDEKSVSEVIEAYLKASGYNVKVTAKGEEGLKLFNKNQFQLIILDLMLPDISGEDICKIIRKNSDVHIFMLTAKSDLNDKIQGLNLGAYEYLVKPFSPRELVARVNALFRRLNKETYTEMVFDNGNLIINYEKRLVKVKGKEVYLTPYEFEILYTLAKNEGKVLTRERLVEEVFGFDFDGFDRNVDTHIKNLRKKIEENTKKPKYIITVVKVGYKFGKE